MSQSRDIFFLEIGNVDEVKSAWFTFSIRKYEDYSKPVIYWRYLGRGRRAFDCFKLSFIFECWWIR